MNRKEELDSSGESNVSTGKETFVQDQFVVDVFRKRTGVEDHNSRGVRGERDGGTGQQKKGRQNPMTKSYRPSVSFYKHRLTDVPTTYLFTYFLLIYLNH